MKTIPERLDWAITNSRMKVPEVAKRAKVPAPTIYSIRNGQRPSPGALILKKLAGVLDVNLDWLTDGTGAPTKSGALEEKAPLQHIGGNNKVDERTKAALRHAIEATLTEQGVKRGSDDWEIVFSRAYARALDELKARPLTA